jgi:hypothetical protein
MEGELKKSTQAKEKTYPKIYSIHSQKGGVGKTSIALAIAGWGNSIRRRSYLSMPI